VSIVIPCRNEKHYIGACLDSILASDFPQERLEVVIADGMSDDGTRELIREYVSAHSRITMIDNPKGTTPCGMNLAIRAARGEIIVRMDAHAMYPPDYLRRLVAAQAETGAENVGTLVVTLPADGTPVAAAIATGLSHPLGVGNSHFRIGTTVRRWVNHVPFGCWQRTLFDRIGYFDEELERAQDVEFNARLLNHGGRILLLPDLTSGYHARKSLSQLARMMYQYGYFKPLVARKAGKILTARQLVPALFVLGGDGFAGFGGPGHAVLVILLGLVIHLIESNFVIPLITAKKVELPPVLTIMSVLVVGSLLGPVGLLVAVPTLAVVMVVLRRILINRIYEGHGFRRAARDRALVLRVPAPEGGVLVTDAPDLDVIAADGRVAA
jgi:glycosyltransferase involved in cell wall biosynthesis